MKSSRYIQLLAVFYLLLTYAMLNAQGWERTYGDSTSEVANDFIRTADNGWIVTGTTTKSGSGDRDVYLLKTDVDGSIQWHRSFGSSGVEDIANASVQLSDGSIIIAGTAGNTFASQGMIWKTNALGDSLLSFATTQDSVTLRDVVKTTDGNLVAIGNRANDFFIVKIDSNGNEIWSQTFGSNNTDQLHEIIALSGNEVVVTGYTHNGSSVNAYVAQIDASGAITWQNNYGIDPDEEQARCITPSQNGGFFIAGFRDNGIGADNEDIWLAEIAADGSLLFDTTLVIAEKERIVSITQLPTGDLILTGRQEQIVSGDRNALVVKTDDKGNIVWSKTYGGLGTDVTSALWANDQNIYFCGTTSSFGAGSFDAWLVKTDASGNSFSSILSGNVFEDDNLNCLPDPNEAGIEGWFVEVSGAKNYYTITDAAGNFAVNVDTGTYQVHLIIPNPYWEPCQNDIVAVLANPNDTVDIQFPIQKISDCSYLTVDVSTPFLRRCFPNTYAVSYCNSGTQTATNAELTLEFDPFLTVDSASVNLTALGGNQFTFQVGNLDPFECGDFKVYTTVDCDSTVLGQTHCTEVRILPDTFCIQPDMTWDGVSLQLEANCSGDSVAVTITNTSINAMSVGRDFIIIEDQVLTRTIPVNLGGGQDTVIKVKPLGATVRFEIDQTPGHPGKSEPSIAVEGCGANPFSIGFVTQFPQDDGDNFVEIDCQENRGSYDPNDKRGFPKGYESAHFIEPETELEYIIRFQNTGTDTAFTVVIRDTLAAELDRSTIQIGSSSHPYEFEIYENGILKFTFNNILLVDSTTNEPGSHGFVKFKITPQKDLPNGTIIYNDADIYFDFNPPITTNETFHQIGMDFITTSTRNPSQPDLLEVRVAPNPFYEQTQIELIGATSQKHQFQLFDVHGRLLRRVDFDGSQFIFRKEKLISGMYFFNIRNRKGMLLGAGKVQLQ